ncbi:MAG: hypothetical protein WC052_04835 [Patescibacteria group bacterium]|jgi:5-methylcytosine-specific restriction endonuclease McrA
MPIDQNKKLSGWGDADVQYQRMQKKLAAFMRIGGECRCETCGCREPEMLTIHYTDRNKIEHWMEQCILTDAAMHEWVLRIPVLTLVFTHLCVLCGSCDRMAETHGYDEVRAAVAREHSRIKGNLV